MIRRHVAEGLAIGAAVVAAPTPAVVMLWPWIAVWFAIIAIESRQT